MLPSIVPVWSVDGARVFYRGTRQGHRNIYWRLVDGSDDEERLTTKPDVSQTPTSVSPDAQWLLFNEYGPQEPGGGVGIWVMRLDGDRTPRRLFAAPAGESDAQFRRTASGSRIRQPWPRARRSTVLNWLTEATRLVAAGR